MQLPLWFLDGSFERRNVIAWRSYRETLVNGERTMPGELQDRLAMVAADSILFEEAFASLNIIASQLFNAVGDRVWPLQPEYR